MEYFRGQRRPIFRGEARHRNRAWGGLLNEPTKGYGFAGFAVTDDALARTREAFDPETGQAKNKKGKLIKSIEFNKDSNSKAV